MRHHRHPTGARRLLIVAAASLAVAVGIPAHASAQEPVEFDQCGPPAAAIFGNGANNQLVGGGVNEEIFGLPGNDDLFGSGGDDILHGGFGDDDLYGGFGDDCLYGDEGDDRLRGGPGWDRCDGGAGNNDVADLTCEVQINIP